VLFTACAHNVKFAYDIIVRHSDVILCN
jgi:hypothetical protein